MRRALSQDLVTPKIPKVQKFRSISETCCRGKYDALGDSVSVGIACKLLIEHICYKFALNICSSYSSSQCHWIKAVEKQLGQDLGVKYGYG